MSKKSPHFSRRTHILAFSCFRLERGRIQKFLEVLQARVGVRRKTTLVMRTVSYFHSLKRPSLSRTKILLMIKKHISGTILIHCLGVTLISYCKAMDGGPLKWSVTTLADWS